MRRAAARSIARTVRSAAVTSSSHAAAASHTAGSLRSSPASRRWCSAKNDAAAATDDKKKAADGAAGGGLGAHFGPGHEHKESLLLKTFVKLGSAIESVTTGFSNSGLGGLIAPKQQQVHTWGKVERSEIEVVEDEFGSKTVKEKREDKRIPWLPIDKETTAMVVSGELQDHSPDESAWGLFKALLTAKKYKTTQQQATTILYEHIPDFSEVEFLEDIETKLMPAFLDAFWSKDIDGLKAMCSDSCYHLNVESHLKQYEKLEPNCRLLMTRRAALFNRLMFIDDSDHAPSVKRRAELSEKGVDLDDLDDLDVDEEKPEAIFFVSCSAHVQNEWHEKKTGEVKVGDAEHPEDWYFVFGLTPQPGPTWTLSSLEFTKMQAMA